LLRLVDGFERRCRQLELPARLEADGAPFGAIPAAKSNDVALLQHLVPAEAIAQRLQQDADAAFALIGHRRKAGGVEGEFLVLGADAPLALRLRPRLEIGDELVPRRDDR